MQEKRTLGSQTAERASLWPLLCEPVQVMKPRHSSMNSWNGSTSGSS